MQKITNDDKPKKIPPDGGWGWMIVIAYGIANIIIIPTITCFGLIFKDKFATMKMSATDVSLIVNLHSAFGMALGLINGPLLRIYGYRKVAIASGVFFCTGMFFTAFSENFTHYIITYGIITATGFGLSNSSFSLALNTYFKVRRNKAAGIAMTITGLGPIIFPFLITFLLKQYGTQGCVMIISAFGLHIIAAASLLQPIKWHLKDPPPPQTPTPSEIEELEPLENKKDSNEKSLEISKNVEIIEPNVQKSNSKISFFSFNQKENNNSKWELSSEDEDDYLENPRNEINHDVDTQSIYGYDLTPQIRRISQSQRFTKSQDFNFTIKQRRRLSREDSEKLIFKGSLSRVPAASTGSALNNLKKINNNISASQPMPKRWFETGSIDSVHLGSSLELFHEKEMEKPIDTVKRIESKDILFPAGALKIIEEEKKILQNINNNNDDKTNGTYPSIVIVKDSETMTKKRRTIIKSLLKKTVKFFDLDLLKDKTYVNMMLGMSIAIFAEINFSILTPFILSDFGYNTEQIAGIMSTLAIADILSRFTSPFLGDYLKQSPRVMYLISLTLLITSRFSIFFATTYYRMLIVGVALGIAKGIRTVYMNLVIPSYVPIERLASASGIQMLANGIFLISFGPLIGLIRDLSGSYARCIIFINLITLTTIVMWTTEMLYCKFKKKNKLNELK